MPDDYWDEPRFHPEHLDDNQNSNPGKQRIEPLLKDGDVVERLKQFRLRWQESGDLTYLGKALVDAIVEIEGHRRASAPAPASGRVDAGLPGPNKQLDRVRIGEGEYVRADEAIKTVMELQRQLYDADKRLASLSPAEMPGVEEIARAMCKAQHYDPDFDYDPNGISDLPGTNVRWKLYVGQARAILALFAPVLAEKERDSLRRETRALAQAQDWRNEAAKAEARALAAEAALAAERERCAKIAEGPEYWPRPPEPGDRLTYRGTADHNWLAVKPPYRINSYSQGRADAAAAIRAQQWRPHDPRER